MEQAEPSIIWSPQVLTLPDSSEEGARVTLVENATESKLGILTVGSSTSGIVTYKGWKASGSTPSTIPTLGSISPTPGTLGFDLIIWESAAAPANQHSILLPRTTIQYRKLTIGANEYTTFQSATVDGRALWRVPNVTVDPFPAAGQTVNIQAEFTNGSLLYPSTTNLAGFYKYVNSAWVKQG